MTLDYYRAIAQRADALRARLGLGPGPILDVVRVLGQAGIEVLVRPLGNDGPDGVYFREAALAVALLNGSKAYTRFRFTAAHELGHHEYGEERALDDDIYGAAIAQRSDGPTRLPRPSLFRRPLRARHSPLVYPSRGSWRNRSASV